MPKFTVIPMLANSAQFERMTNARCSANYEFELRKMAIKYAGAYNAQREQVVTAEDEEGAAEEVFDIHGNPGRWELRKALDWDESRTLSMGDMVSVNGNMYLCLPVGWQKITLE